MNTIWGQSVWIFLHTILEQLSEEQFIQHKQKIVRDVFDIFSNIPCDFCRAEAITEYKTNVNKWVTKDDVRMFIFHFHNKVNRKLKKFVHPIEKLKVYKTISIQNAASFLNTRFGSYKHGFKMHLNLKRRQVCKTISNFYIQLLS